MGEGLICVRAALQYHHWSRAERIIRTQELHCASTRAQNASIQFGALGIEARRNVVRSCDTARDARHDRIDSPRIAGIRGDINGAE